MASPAGVFQSLDGGSVWAQLTNADLQGQGNDGGGLLVGSGSTPPLYLSTQNGVVVSADGGHSWNPVLTGGPVISLQFSTTDHSHLFAAVSSPKNPAPGFVPGVFEAVGGGLSAGSWRQLKGCPGAPLPNIPALSEVWITESHGTKWVSFKGSSIELWRSTGRPCQLAGGQEDSWEQVPLARPCSDPTNQWSFLVAHPADPAVLFKGGVDLCRSGDRGSTMTRVGPVHGDQHAIAVATGNSAVMYEGNDGGIYRSDDTGATWRFIGEGLAVSEFYDLDSTGQAPRVFLGGTQDNAFISWDGVSPIWNSILCPNPGNCGDTSLVAFDRVNKSVSYEIGQSTEQLNSYTNGASEQGIGDDNHKCLASSESPTILRSLVSTGITTLPVVVTCQGLWLGPPWVLIQSSGAGVDFVRAKLGPGGMWLTGTDQGKIQGGSSLLFFNPLFASPVSKTTSALAFADSKTFYVGVTSRSGPNESGPRIFRLDCQFGGTVTCGNQEISQFLVPGEVMAIASDPLHRDTVLVALRGKGIFRGVRIDPVIEWLPEATAARRSGTSQPSQKVSARVVNPGLISIFNTWRWSPYNNGLPAGITATRIDSDSNGHFALATFGRGAFVLHSGAELGASGSVSAYITSFEEERLNPGPAGASNPLLVTVEMDSRPGWIFTAVNLGAPAYVLKTAYAQHRRVVLNYHLAGPQHGTITGAH
jgi:hypothetical protein